MPFLQLLNTLSRSAKILDELIAKNALFLLPTTDGILFRCSDTKNLCPLALRHLKSLEGKTSAIIEALIMGHAIHDGPKIFTPKQNQLEMLEHIDLNILFEDYVQPFETVIIELPTNYVSNKLIICPQAGQVIANHLIVGEHTPTVVIIHKKKDARIILAEIVFEPSNLAISMCLAPPKNDEIETYLKSYSDSDRFNDSLVMSGNERNGSSSLSQLLSASR
jgi:hypothetical protein